MGQIISLIFAYLIGMVIFYLKMKTNNSLNLPLDKFIEFALYEKLMDTT